MQSKSRHLSGVPPFRNVRPPPLEISAPRSIRFYGVSKGHAMGNGAVQTHFAVPGRAGGFGFGLLLPIPGKERSVMSRKKRFIGSAVVCAGVLAVFALTASRASADNARLTVTPAIFRTADGN